MKRLLAFLIVVCLAAGCVSIAMAAKITITSQPVSQTTKVGGTLTFKVKAKNAGDQPITWYFMNPETGETTTGKKLPNVVQGVKVTRPNSLNITLKKIPESLHGWVLYCHIGMKGTGATSNYAMILIEGKEVPPMPVQTRGSSTSDTNAATVDAAGSPLPTATPEPIVVKAGTKVDLYEMDRKGNVISGAKPELTFTQGSANFMMKLQDGVEDPIQYFSIDSIRITPEGENVTGLTGLSIRNLEHSATAKIKLFKPSTGAEIVPREAKIEEADPSTLVNVTCEFCRFTGYNNTFAESGQVPVGTTITVVASGGRISKGYFINGAKKGEYKNQASFQLVIEGDTTIKMEKQK